MKADLLIVLALLAASTAFMSPISPINTMVATAGDCRFADLVRVGRPLDIIEVALNPT